MNRLISIIIALLLHAGAHSQPSIRVNELSYIYIGNRSFDESGQNFGYVQQRIIYALQDSLISQMKNSLIKGVNSHWDASLDARNLNIKVDDYNNLFKEFPKFKPKLQKNNPGGFELYLRIVDRGSNSFLPIPSQPNPLATRLIFECKVLNSNDGSEAFSRKMEVNFKRAAIPDGAYPLIKVPGLPASFVAAFDSSASVFFGSSAPDFIEVTVAPACLFISRELGSTIRQTVKFEVSGNEIKLVNGPEIAWSPGKLEEQKSGKTKRTGNGIGSGIFTAVTGLQNEKEKTVTKAYMTRILMADGGTGSAYGFHIPIKEETTTTVTTYKEKSNGSSSIRTDEGGSSMNRIIQEGAFITRGNDTIGRFYISREPTSAYRDELRYCWDGRDSSTIIPMPSGWSSDGQYTLMHVTGELYGKSFEFSNSKAGNQLDVWYNNDHLATFKMDRGLPSDGLVYETETPDEVLKVLAMFTSLPYGYYGFRL